MLSRLYRTTLLKQQLYIPIIRRFKASSKIDDIIETDEWQPLRLHIESTSSVNEGSMLDGPVTTVDSLVPKPLPFNGPLRDHKNFARPETMDFPAPTRLACIPENWFQFLYPKLGVTGPYTLGIGLYLLVVQKEYLPTDEHEWKHCLAVFGWVYVMCRTKLGLILQELIFDKPVMEFKNKIELWEKSCTVFREEAIEAEKEEQWRMQGKNLLYEAKKENVGLQLEAIYRENVMDMYSKVKKRLDYLVEVGNIDSRIKRQYMIDWVVNQVQSNLAKTPEKETLKQCISDLNMLAARV